MRIADLLAEDSLQLRLHTPSAAARLAQSITFSAQAEFLDPTPYLSSGCLLITNGIGFNFTDPQIWEAYVERLAAVPVAAIAFVTGIAHRLIPAGLVAAATTHNVPLLEVPHAVPAIQLQRHITSVLEAERFALTKQSWSLADRCAHITSGVGDILAEISDAVHGPVAIYDALGDVVARWPQESDWGHNDLAAASSGLRGAAFELPMGGTETIYLVARSSLTREPLAALLGPASSILAVHLNTALRAAGRDAARLATLVRQLHDGDAISTKELARAFRAAGLDPGATTYFVVSQPQAQRAGHTWKLRLALHDVFEVLRVHASDGLVYAFGQGEGAVADVHAAVIAMCEALSGQVPLVVAHPADSVAELRLAVGQARQILRDAAKSGAGFVWPHVAAPFSLAALLASGNSGLHAAAHKLLQPVLDYDAAHGGRLLDTLRTYLHHNAQPVQTAKALYIHRNTLTKRLALIGSLIEMPLDELETQATCLLALRLVSA